MGIHTGYLKRYVQGTYDIYRDKYRALRWFKQGTYRDTYEGTYKLPTKQKQGTYGGTYKVLTVVHTKYLWCNST